MFKQTQLIHWPHIFFLDLFRSPFVQWVLIRSFDNHDHDIACIKNQFTLYRLGNSVLETAQSYTHNKNYQNDKCAIIYEDRNIRKGRPLHTHTMWDKINFILFIIHKHVVNVTCCSISYTCVMCMYLQTYIQIWCYLCFASDQRICPYTVTYYT